MKRWHLTQDEINTIKALTRQGMRQSQIARKLGIGADTVRKWQTKMGLTTHLVWPEEKILRLFEKGWGGYRIAKHLRVPVNQVFATAHKNHFRRKDGIGYPEPHGDIPGFIEALRRREDYVKRLARKYHVGLCKANRIAHEILGTYRFRPGVAKPPLSSDFPQKHHDAKGRSIDAMAAELAEKIAKEIFGGSLPIVSSRDIAFAIASVCLPPQTDERVLNEYLAALVPALEARRIAQENRWPN